jgi:hypothetical protein
VVGVIFGGDIAGHYAILLALERSGEGVLDLEVLSLAAGGVMQA